MHDPQRQFIKLGQAAQHTTHTFDQFVMFCASASRWSTVSPLSTDCSVVTNYTELSLSLRDVIFPGLQDIHTKCQTTPTTPEDNHCCRVKTENLSGIVEKLAARLGCVSEQVFWCRPRRESKCVVFLKLQLCATLACYLILERIHIKSNTLLTLSLSLFTPGL